MRDVYAIEPAKPVVNNVEAAATYINKNSEFPKILSVIKSRFPELVEKRDFNLVFYRYYKEDNCYRIEITCKDDAVRERISGLRTEFAKYHGYPPAYKFEFQFRVDNNLSNITSFSPQPREEYLSGSQRVFAPAYNFVASKPSSPVSSSSTSNKERVKVEEIKVVKPQVSMPLAKKDLKTEAPASDLKELRALSSDEKKQLDDFFKAIEKGYNELLTRNSPKTTLSKLEAFARSGTIGVIAPITSFILVGRNASDRSSIVVECAKLDKLDGLYTIVDYLIKEAPDLVSMSYENSIPVGLSVFEREFLEKSLRKFIIKTVSEEVITGGSIKDNGKEILAKYGVTCTLENKQIKFQFPKRPFDQSSILTVDLGLPAAPNGIEYYLPYTIGLVYRLFKDQK